MTEDHETEKNIYVETSYGQTRRYSDFRMYLICLLPSKMNYILGLYLRCINKWETYDRLSVCGAWIGMCRGVKFVSE